MPTGSRQPFRRCGAGVAQGPEHESAVAPLRKIDRVRPGRERRLRIGVDAHHHVREAAVHADDEPSVAVDPALAGIGLGWQTGTVLLEADLGLDDHFAVDVVALFDCRARDRMPVRYAKDGFIRW